METLRDDQLLQRWLEGEAQWAFAEIGRRYAGLVFNVCLRELGDSMLAEDASQAVFLLLAQKAPKLRKEGALAGWLFRTAQLVAYSCKRQEGQRKRKEAKIVHQLAAEQEARNNESALWEEMAPHLNTALARLKPADREAILLRCLQGYSFVETGAALGITENTARMRVTRALAKLRTHLVKAGVVVSVSTLSVLLTEHGAQSAPVTLFHAVEGISSGSIGMGGTASASVLASKTASATAELSRAHLLAKGAAITMAISTGKTIAATIGVAVLLLGGVAWHNRRQLHSLVFPDSTRNFVEVAVVLESQENAVIEIFSRGSINRFAMQGGKGSRVRRFRVPPRLEARAKRLLARNGIQNVELTPEEQASWKQYRKDVGAE